MDQLGFFKQKDMKKVQKEKVSKPSCEICKLWEKCQSPKMEVSGNGKKGILIIGEASGRTEDIEGIQFVGDAGKLLGRKLKFFGYDLHEDFNLINAVNCRPPNNREPSKKEIKCCRERVQKVIEEKKPKLILLFGGVAVESLFGNLPIKNLDMKIGNWRRLCIPYKTEYGGCWVVSLYHPSYLLQNKDANLESVFDKDLRWALSCLDQDPPEFPDYESEVTCVESFEVVVSILEIILSKPNKIIDYDYETTCLDPRREGAKIVSISVATEDGVYSFPFNYQNHWTEQQFATIKNDWICILEDPQILKSGQNIKFEEKWNRRILKTKCKGWVHDTMTTTHLLDPNRSKFTKLSLQVYLNWGIIYDEEIGKYIKSKDGYLNTMENCPLDILLLYGGLDSFFTRKIRKKQEKILSKRIKLQIIFGIYMDGLRTFMDMEETGIPIDVDYYKKNKVKLNESMNILYEEMKNSSEAKKFKESQKREIGLILVNDKISVSTKDLGILIYDVLGMKSENKTKTGKPKLDEETISDFGIPFCDKLIEFRKVRKTCNTYFDQFLREAVDGKINPCNNLHIARSGRSSVNNPNFQNIPIHNDEASKAVRSGILPSKGRQLLAADYSSLEVRIIACYTKDPVLVDYVKNNGDPHADMAVDLFMLPKKDITKSFRYIAKNNAVFPWFYGSWYKQVAENIWKETLGLEISPGFLMHDHFRNKGVKTYWDFKAHIQEVERKFWKKFIVSKNWQESHIQQYRKRGYVESYFGFRREGYLSNNIVLNTDVQGTGFHCLLWSLPRNSKFLKSGFETDMLGQIHDEILFDLVPEELEEIVIGVRKVMCEDIRKEFDWLIVPLEVEFDITEVDGSWYTKKSLEE